MQLTKRSARADEGFTLIELLISITILGIIAFPLAGIVISYFKDSAAADARLTESHDQQIAASYWQQDVASVGLRSTTYDNSASVHTFPLVQSVYPTLQAVPAPNCSSSLPAGTQVITLAWHQFAPDGSQTGQTVTYLTQASSTRFALVRVRCAGATVTSTTTVAHELTSVPTVVCSGGGVSGCADSTGAVPSTVSMTLNVSDPSGKGTPYSVTLTGQRRQT